MIKKVLTIMRQVGATALLATNSVVHIAPLLLIALVKFVVRIKPVTRACDRGLMGLVASWISVNSWMMAHLTHTKIEVTGLPERQLDGHFLVISNHQSWVDIPVLQRVFNRRLPMLRFFLKSQLIWVPILGLAWWALDFPFMKRYSREQIAKRPELAGKDLETTQRACDKFANIPVSVVNFVEGTRFRASKQEAQGADFTHLLKPRAGGTAFVLNAMGETLDTLVDVTIAYPNGRGELMDLFANRIDTIRVHIQTLAIPERFRGGDYHTDPVYRAEFQAWLNDLWAKKDQTLTQLLT
ncbi:MAG TPA: acyltransferase [Wenzhouxiangella sp.]